TVLWQGGTGPRRPRARRATRRRSGPCRRRVRRERRRPGRRSLERAPPVLRLQGVCEVFEGAGHDLVELVLGQLDPVVGHAILREVVGADLLRALAAADLRAALRGELGLLLLALELVQPRA